MARRHEAAGRQATPSHASPSGHTFRWVSIPAAVTQVNKQVRLAARPSGLLKASDWTITSEPVPAPDG